MLELNLPYNLTLDLVAVGDVIAATMVTKHALLHNRDVRASIGWIGLAWLSPILGSLIYFVFGINRIERRAIRLRQRAVRSAVTASAAVQLNLANKLQENILSLSKVGDRLTNDPIVAGNSISIYRSGDEAYPAMLEAIQSARESIALASYIFRADHVGNAFIVALRAANQKGVKIRVLVDGIGSGYFYSSAVHALLRAGIPAERFLHDWLPWRMPFLNMRNHKKLLIVDGTIGFTGGLNLGAENTRRPKIAHAVEDIHFKIQGPAVSMLMKGFADDWTFTCGETLDNEIWWPELSTRGPALMRGINSGPDDDNATLETILAAAVSSAKRQLRIVTPYFLPDHRIMSDIALAAIRGVTVDLIIPAHSNHRILDWATRSHLGFFGVTGLNIYLTPLPFDHSKMVTVDGFWCGLGSPNWDLRSLRLNFEFMLECYDAPFVKKIDTLIDQKIARSKMLHLKQLQKRPTRIKLRDAAARLLLPYL